MSAELDRRLAYAVVEMRSASPPAWDAFLGVLADRLESISEKALSSAPDNSLIQNQGRALEARELFKALVQAPKLAEDLRDKERANAHTARKP